MFFLSGVMEYDMIFCMDTTVQAKPCGLSEFHLKIIAYTCMFIDHVGAFIIWPYTNANLETMGYQMMHRMDVLYNFCRIMGRIAFPLFCFMLVEGIFHTKNKWRYLARLVIFAGLSDIPFDLANELANNPFEPASAFRPFSYAQQSVMITLAIGLLMLILMEKIRHSGIPVVLRELLMYVPVAAAATLAYFVNCDYDFKGILMIAGLYLMYPLLRIDRTAYALGGGVLFFWEWMNRPSRVTSSLALIPLLFYNGKKGKSAKWFFYFFYPAHLLLLYGIAYWLLFT